MYRFRQKKRPEIMSKKKPQSLTDVSVSAVNQHLKRIFEDNKLECEATIKRYLIVQTEGKAMVDVEVGDE